MSPADETIPKRASQMSTLSGLTAGAWNVDASHSEVGFSARHLMVSWWA
jgi:polyisoprenoid-binding protein YceI